MEKDPEGSQEQLQKFDVEGGSMQLEQQVRRNSWEFLSKHWKVSQTSFIKK